MSLTLPRCFLDKRLHHFQRDLWLVHHLRNTMQHAGGVNTKLALRLPLNVHSARRFTHRVPTISYAPTHRHVPCSSNHNVMHTTSALDVADRRFGTELSLHIGGNSHSRYSSQGIQSNKSLLHDELPSNNTHPNCAGRGGISVKTSTPTAVLHGITCQEQLN